MVFNATFNNISVISLRPNFIRHSCLFTCFVIDSIFLAHYFGLFTIQS